MWPKAIVSGVGNGQTIQFTGEVPVKTTHGVEHR
jgi:hypothetical protein